MLVPRRSRLIFVYRTPSYPKIKESNESLSAIDCSLHVWLGMWCTAVFYNFFACVRDTTEGMTRPHHSPPAVDKTLQPPPSTEPVIDAPPSYDYMMSDDMPQQANG